MRRFFGNIVKNTPVFSDESLKHIKVIRLNMGENIEFCCNSKIYICQVTKLKPFEAKIIDDVTEKVNRELQYNLVLFCPLLKRENFELVIQKATELGVKEIYPYLSSRVIKRISKQEFELRRERFEKILLNASEQSNRTIIPKLYPLEDFNRLSGLYKDSSNKFIAYEDEALKGQKISIEKSDSKNIVFVFGPEGGFSKEEVDLYKDNGFKIVSLGKRILRAETAAFYGLSCIDYLIE